LFVPKGRTGRRRSDTGPFFFVKKAGLSAFAVPDRADLHAVAATAVVAAQDAHAAIRADMAMHHGADAGHEMPAGVAVAITSTAATAINAHRPAVAAVTMGYGAAVFGDVVPANVGMTPANLNDIALGRRLCAG